MIQPAGKLDQRITIEQKSITRNSIGEEVESWSTLATVWAGYRPISVRESIAGAQLQANFEAVFRVRKIAIDPEMRVVWRGERYEIVGAPLMLDARSGEMDVFVRKGVRDGR